VFFWIITPYVLCRWIPTVLSWIMKECVLCRWIPTVFFWIMTPYVLCRSIPTVFFWIMTPHVLGLLDMTLYLFDTLLPTFHVTYQFMYAEAPLTKSTDLDLNFKHKELKFLRGRNALLRVDTQRVVVISYRRFGTIYLSHPEVSRI